MTLAKHNTDTKGVSHRRPTLRPFLLGCLAAVLAGCNNGSSEPDYSAMPTGTFNYQRDNNADGVADDTYSLAVAFDSSGVIRRRIEQWEGFDARTQSNHKERLITTYDSRGNPIRSVFGYGADAGENGTGRYAYTYINTYDAQGNLVAQAVENDWYADAAVKRYTFTVYTYDDHGNLTRRVYEHRYGTDGAANGTPDFRRTYTATYDADGNVTSEATEEDYGANGISENRELSTMSYDAYGNLTSETRDGDGDGSPESSDTYTYTYDAEGRLLSSVEFRDSLDSDGTVGWRDTTTTTYEYGAEIPDKPSRKVEETDFDNDGIPNSRTVSTLAYDTQGNITSLTLEGGPYPADGTVNWRTASTYTYDAAGRFAGMHTASDLNADGGMETEEQSSASWPEGITLPEELAALSQYHFHWLWY